VRWPGKTSGAIGFALNFLCYFLCFKAKKVNGDLHQGKKYIKQLYNLKMFLCSFFCLCKRKNETCLPAGREKHPGNDVRPLPDALIKLQYYC